MAVLLLCVTLVLITALLCFAYKCYLGTKCFHVYEVIEKDRMFFKESDKLPYATRYVLKCKTCGCLTFKTSE